MVYKAPEGAVGGEGDTSDVEEETAQAKLSSSDTENVNEARGKEKLTGKGGKISAATEEMSVYYLM